MSKFLFGILISTTCFSLTIAARTISIAAPDPPAPVSKQSVCKNPPNQNATNTCARNEYQNADKKMKQVYQQLLNKLPDDRKRRLMLAQQNWIAYREANCEFERSEVAGGTMEPAVHSRCMAELTQQRTARLQKYVK